MEESVCYYLFPVTMSMLGLSMLFMMRKALRDVPAKMEKELPWLNN